MPAFVLNNIHPVGRVLEPEQMQGVIERVTAVSTAMHEAGVWLFSTHLTGPNDASVVRSADGSVSVVDGPFSEAKEYVGGSTIIDVADRDSALSWAGQVATATGLPVEVRPAMYAG